MRSLTVKAVCGGTLGWMDPPFNSILALPGATHQDPTQNEIINDLNNLKMYINSLKVVYINSLKIGYINSQRIIRIKWLKNKMRRQINDSYRPLNNTEKKARQCKYGRSNWLKNKTCRQTNDSYRLPKKDTRQKKIYCQIFWHKNKVCRQMNDSSNYPKNSGQWQYSQIFSLKIKMCHLRNDSCHSPKITFSAELQKQHDSQKKLPVIYGNKVSFGKKISCPTTDKDIQFAIKVEINPSHGEKKNSTKLKPIA